MTKKQRANLIIEELEKEYPLADCTLDYDEAWKLLVSVRLAAQWYRCPRQCGCKRFIWQISEPAGTGTGFGRRN